MIMRASLLLPLLLIPLGVRGQQVEYSTPGVPLRIAVGEISRLAGKKLKVGDDLANEPIVLRLADVPLDEAMRRIASVMQGEWVATKEGSMLTRTPALTTRLLEERRSARLALIDKELKKFQDARKQIPILNDEAADRIARQYATMLASEKEGKRAVGITRDQLSNLTADARLFADIVQAIGAEPLASVPLGSTHFAIHPTQMQIGIAGISDDRLAQYVRERNALARALGSAVDPKAHDGMLFTGIQQANQSIQSLPIRVLVNVEAQPGHRLFLEMQVYDGRGYKVSNTTWAFGRPDYAEYQASRKKAMDNPARKPAVKAWPALTELAQRELREGAPIGVKPLSKEALDLLLHSDVHDPIQLGFGPTVLDFGKQEGLNVVATLPDDQMVIALRGTGKGLVQPEVFELALTCWGRTRFERKDGWLLVDNADPLEATAGRLDRASLATYLQSSYERGYTSLEDWAGVAIANPYPTCFNAVLGFRNVLRGQDAMYDYAPWDAYRLYGLLSDSQFEALRQGQALLYGALSSEQQECVHRLVYEWDVIRPIPTGDAQRDYRAALGAEDALGGQPTEALPDGIPRTLAIKMGEEQQERFFLSTDMEYRGGVVKESDQPVDLNWVAMLIAQNQRPDIYPAGTVEKVKAIRYGSERIVTFQFRVSEGSQAEAKMKEERKPTDEPMLVEDLSSRLPPSVWKRLDEAIRKQLDYMQKYAAQIKKDMPKPEKAPPPPPVALKR